MDNFGDSVGLVADWLAFERWWRPHPLIARGGRGCIDHQLSDRPSSGLTDNFPQKAQRKDERRKESSLSECEFILSMAFFAS